MRIRIRIAAAVGRHSLGSTRLASPLSAQLWPHAHTRTHTVARTYTLVCAGGQTEAVFVGT